MLVLRTRLSSLLLISIWLHLWLVTGKVWAAPSQADSRSPTVEAITQGDRLYQSGHLPQAISTWQTALTQTAPNQQAALLEKLARAYLQIGQPEQSIQSWTQAAQVYQTLGAPQKQGQMLTEQAQVHSLLGQYRSAIAILCGSSPANCKSGSAIAIAQMHQDSLGEIAALGSLGNTYWQQGDFDQAISTLALAVAKQDEIKNESYAIALNTGLGNAHASRAALKYEQARSLELAEGTVALPSVEAQSLKTLAKAADQDAIRYFEQSLTLAQQRSNRSAQFRTWLNLIPIYNRTLNQGRAREAHSTASKLLEMLPASSTQARGAIDLAYLLDPSPLGQSQFVYCPQATSIPEAKQYLIQAKNIAKRLGDRRSESFALGALGHLAECLGQYPQALELTYQAQWLAESASMQDSQYLWDWQIGRILQQDPAKQDAADHAYQRALSQLATVRGNRVLSNRDRQLDFRTRVEPIYRDSMRLSLDQQEVSQPVEPLETRPTYQTVIETLDSLKLAELQNYFGNDCVITSLPRQKVELSQVDAQAAIIHTLILGDRTAVILTLPDQTQHLKWIAVETSQLQQTLKSYRFQLERRFDPIFDPQQAQQLYDWMIRPFEPILTDTEVQTLVFVQDGIFRGVPMAALHNGDRYLVEQYAIASAVSFQLVDPQPIPIKRLKALTFGLTKEATIEGQRFPKLPYVQEELENVQQLLPGTIALLNQQWSQFKQQLASQDINTVHVATHAQFGSTPENTFLVIGAEQKLTMTEFEALLRESTRARTPIELLVLTACQTAYGDDRSALGLAGVALQAGTKTVMASLWAIADASTATLATEFYQTLQSPNMNKAEALRRAQLKLINGDPQWRHPAYWAPYVLIGNWL